MRAFRKTLMPALAGAVLFSGAGDAMAMSQVQTETVRHQIKELRRDVNRNLHRDLVAGREAIALRREVNLLQDQFHEYDRDGLSSRELRALENRIESIRGRLYGERHDSDQHRR